MNTNYEYTNCINCENLIKEGDTVYLIRNSDGIYYPTCCNKCAEEFKQETIDLLQNKINKIKKQKIEIDTW